MRNELKNIIYSAFSKQLISVVMKSDVKHLKLQIKVPANLPFNHKIFLKHRNAVKGVKKIYVLRRKNEIVVKFILLKVFFDG